MRRAPPGLAPVRFQSGNSCDFAVKAGHRRHPLARQKRPTGEIRDLGDKVVALGEISGIIRGSDVPVRQPMGIIAWDFRGGKIGGSRFFPSWEQALEAVGLRE